MSDTRMFTDGEESRIFSIAGELRAALQRAKASYMRYEEDMTVRLPGDRLADIDRYARDLMHLCTQALEREHLPEELA